MSRPNRADTTTIWLQPAWLACAHEWIRARLADRDVEPTGAIEQAHVRWWSTVMRVLPRAVPAA